MKKFFALFFVITICFISCATSNNSISQSKNNENNNSFREFYFEHDLISGETIIYFYGLPEQFHKYSQEETGALYNDLYKVEQFDFISDEFNTVRGYLSYKLILKAKFSLLQNENITAILSKVLNKNIEVGYMQPSSMTKDAARPWSIVFDDTDNSIGYFDGNAVATYWNGNLLKSMYIFDLSKNKIEFGMTKK